VAPYRETHKPDALLTCGMSKFKVFQKCVSVCALTPASTHFVPHFACTWLFECSVFLLTHALRVARRALQNMPYHHHKPLVLPVDAPKAFAPGARPLPEPPKLDAGMLAPPRLEQRRHSAPDEAEATANAAVTAAAATAGRGAVATAVVAPRPPPSADTRHSGAYGFDGGGPSSPVAPTAAPTAGAGAAAAIVGDRVHSGAYGFDDAGDGGAGAARKSKVARPLKPAFKVSMAWPCALVFSASAAYA
jgi:hypothetical protein